VRDRAGSDRPFGQVRKFNPGTLQPDRELIGQFVVRKRELELVLEVLRGNVDAPSCQHLLVVAPRGRGKTMLLARVAAELRTDDGLCRSLLPVRFMEESHEILDMNDFWLETLFHLARESAEAFPEMAQELAGTHADLSARRKDPSIEELARAAVLDAAERAGRKLVLMIENLQALCGNVEEDFGWQLRGVLQSEPRIVLLASATSRFEELEDPREPFFELFRIVSLGPLATEECHCLWEAMTGDRAGARDIRPLEILTGGNCRLLAIVAGFSEHRSLRRLMEELVRLVDEHTEYFRGHLEVLPRAERRVYVAVLDLWQPSSTGEIAARARMDVRAVSTMLGRLVRRGAVIGQPSTGGRRRRYVAAEPLYSIYYKLRRERDDAAVVEGLIQFMLAFYDWPVLFVTFDRLWSEARDAPALHSGIDRVLQGRPADQDLQSRILWDTLAEASRKAWDNRRAAADKALDDGIVMAFEERSYGRVLELVDRYVAEGWDKRAGTRADHTAVYLAHLRADAHFGLGEFEEVIAIGCEVLDRFRESRDVFIVYRSARILSTTVVSYYETGSYREAVDCAARTVEWIDGCDTPDWQIIVALVLRFAAKAHAKLGDTEAAVTKYDDIVTKYGARDELELQLSVVEALIDKADLARVQLNDPDEAVAVYDVLISRHGESDRPEFRRAIGSALLNRAFVLGNQRKFEEETAGYDSVIDYVGQQEGSAYVSSVALAFKALRLAELGRTEEALAASAVLERDFGQSNEDWGRMLAWFGLAARAVASTVLRDPAATDAFRAAFDCFPAGNEVMTRLMIRLVLNLVAVGAREEELAKVLKEDRKKFRSIAPLVAALSARIGEPVRGPAEVLEVAADIRRALDEKSAKGILREF